MKRIDETQLLLAVGEVGDDLLLRAERQPSRRRNPHLKWGAMAACFCLIAALAVPNLLDSFRMGSSNGSSASMEPGAWESADADYGDGQNVEGAALDDMGGQSGEPSLETEYDAVSTPEAAQDGAACLAELGITGAADIADFYTTQKAADNDEKLRENRAQQFYDALASAVVVSAEEDGSVFLPSVVGTLELSSGDSLTFLYDPEHGALELGAYHYYHENFSDLLGGE